jgi:hypothetical protein
METIYNILQYNPVTLYRIAKYKRKIIETLTYIGDTKYEVGEISLTKKNLFNTLINSKYNNSKIFDTALNQLTKDNLVSKIGLNQYSTTEDSQEFLTLNGSFIKHLVIKYVVWSMPIALSVYASWNKANTVERIERLENQNDSLLRAVNSWSHTDSVSRKSYTQ